MTSRSYFLELPVEIRLRIYEYMYNQKFEPQLFVRNDTDIQQPMTLWFRNHPGSAILKTCRQCHAEASPILYDKTYFRIQILIGDGWPKYQFSGGMDGSNPLLGQIQHVEITIHLSKAADLDPALHRLEVLAKAFEDAEAVLKTMIVVIKAVTSYEMAVTWELVATRRDQILRRLGEQRRAGVKSNRLFLKMLLEGSIVSVR